MCPNISPNAITVSRFFDVTQDKKTNWASSRDSTDPVLSDHIGGIHTASVGRFGLVHGVKDGDADFLAHKKRSQEFSRGESVGFVFSLRRSHSRSGDSTEVKDSNGIDDGKKMFQKSSVKEQKRRVTGRYLSLGVSLAVRPLRIKVSPERTAVRKDDGCVRFTG